MQLLDTPPRRLVRTALAAAGAYVVVTSSYFAFADRLLAGVFGLGGDTLAFHVLKGWVFILLTGVALFLLVWRLNLASWRRAQADAARALQEAREQSLLENLLAEVGQQLRLLVEGTPSFFFYLQDAEGVVTYVSPTVERITGRPVTEWLGQRHWFATANPLNEEARQATARHLAGELDGKPVLVEVEHGEGQPVLLEVHEYGRFDQDRLVGLQGIAHDVTERRRSEVLQAAISKISQAAITARTLDELFPAIHAVVAELMPACNFYIALHDPVADRVSFPYFVDEVDPPPPPRRAARGLTEYVLRTGRSVLASPEVLDSLERAGEIELLGAPSIDWLGVPLRFHERTIGVLVVQSYAEGLRYGERDKELLEFVSTQIAMAIERTRAEEALRESEERYRRLVELLPDGIGIHCDGQLVFLNQQACSLLGLASPEQAVGRSVLDFVHPGDRAMVVERIRRGVEEGEVQPPLEERFLRPDGSVIHAEVAATPFVFRGKPSTLVVFRDIGERLRMAERLRQTQKMEAVGQLAGGVAHDFNNLLQVLLAAVQMLRTEGEDRERRARTLAEVEAHCRRGASLTRQLLLFSRQEVTRGEPLDLGAVVRDAADLLDRLVPARVRMALEPAGVPLPVVADRGQLEQVLVNLVLNACDSMPTGGELSVRTGRTGSSAWVEVADSGSGIPETVRERMFEPFFTTKASGQGSGLGLTVIHGIVAAHGGEVQVETREGRGTTFRVLLPCHTAGEPTPPRQAAAAPSLPRGQGERILLVEDEPAAREGLADVLGLLGYRVTAVASGEEACILPDLADFDLLLTDLALPGISGAELGAHLRERWPDLAVIVMSGYAADEAVRRAVGEGRVLFLQKPFPMDSLARELRATLEARHRLPS